MFAWLKRRRREAIRCRPFPTEWHAIIKRNVSYAARLSSEDQNELAGHVQVFLTEKRFEGCGGLQITDEMRVTIAAQACILLLHRRTDYYPQLVSILVYPAAYVVPGGARTPDGFVADEPQARLGESWRRGVLVLAWDSALAGAADAHDGHNVVLHSCSSRHVEERLCVRATRAGSPWSSSTMSVPIDARTDAASAHDTEARARVSVAPR